MERPKKKRKRKKPTLSKERSLESLPINPIPWLWANIVVSCNIYKPSFNLIVSLEIEVSICTCKWHLTVPNLSFCWVFNVHALVRDWTISTMKNFNFQSQTIPGDCQWMSSQTRVAHNFCLYRNCLKILDWNSMRSSSTTLFSYTSSKLRRRHPKTCCIGINKYARKTLNGIDSPPPLLPEL